MKNHEKHDGGTGGPGVDTTLGLSDHAGLVHFDAASRGNAPAVFSPNAFMRLITSFYARVCASVRNHIDYRIPPGLPHQQQHTLDCIKKPFA